MFKRILNNIDASIFLNSALNKLLEIYIKSLKLFTHNFKNGKMFMLVCNIINY